MTHGAKIRGQGDVRALRHELLSADDQKLRRVTAMVDNVGDPVFNQALLDPIRPRIASLRPARPLRFARLLFIPLDRLIVPARSWRPDEPAVPRTVLTPIARTVHAGLGSEAAAIDRAIAGVTADAATAISQLGETLWPRAADILATATAPVDWMETGLPMKTYSPLVRGIAAVLRQAPRLRALARDAEMGTRPSDERELEGIAGDIAAECEEGCAMLVRLILADVPHAVPFLRKTAASSLIPEEKAQLRAAMTRGTAEAVDQLESPAGMGAGLSGGSLTAASEEVRRIVALLHAIDQDANAAKYRPRLNAIRERLGRACQVRFADGVREVIAAPLAVASEPVDSGVQTRLESGARELRILDMEARKLGGAEKYDRLLEQAEACVRAAAAAGTLTPMRHLRLVEILASSMKAEVLYRQMFPRDLSPEDLCPEDL